MPIGYFDVSFPIGRYVVGGWLVSRVVDAVSGPPKFLSAGSCRLRGVWGFGSVCLAWSITVASMFGSL